MKTIHCVSLSSLLVIYPAIGLGAQWSLQPAVSLVAGFEDNVMLSPTSATDSYHVRHEPRIKAQWATQITHASVDAGIKDNFYSANGLSRTDLFLGASVSHRNVLNSWELESRYTQDSTLDSELEETGLVFDRTTRKNLVITPTWTRQLTPTISTNLEYSLSLSDFSSNDSNLEGFSFHSLTGGLTYQYSAKTGLSSSLGYSLFNTDSGNVESINTSLQLSINHRFSEKMLASLAIGSRQTTTTQQASTPVGFIINNVFFQTGTTVGISETTQNGTTLSASLVRTMERGEFSASISRAVQPSGSNGLIESDRINLRGSYEINSNLRSSLDLNWFASTNTTTSSTVTNLDRQHIDLSPALHWKLSPDLSLSAIYRYRRQEFIDSQETAASNAILIRLTRNWKGINKSR